MNPHTVKLLRQLGITRFDPDSELHQALKETLDRIGNAPPDVMVPALSWCYHAEYARQVDAMARAKVEYDRTLGAGVIRYRAMGEKSAEVAKMRAEADDPGVYLSRLEFLKAEGMMKAAMKAIDILADTLSAWQTRQADARTADRYHAETA